MKIIAIGVGGFGIHWRDAYMSHDIEVVGLVDPAETNLREAQQYFGLPDSQCVSDYKDALTQIDADAVVITSPPRNHYEHAHASLTSGHHVLVVKPLAHEFIKAAQLVELAKATDRKLVVAQQKRYLPAFVRLRNLLAENAIGDIGFVDLQLSVKGTAWKSGFGWRSRRNQPVIMGAGSHQLDLLRWCLDREVKSIWARTWNVPWSPFLGQSAAIAMVEMSGGLPVSYRINWAPKSDTFVDFFSGWRIEGTDGVITIDGAEIYLNGEAGNLVPQDGPPSLATLNCEVMLRFVEYVNSGIAPGISGADNLLSLAPLFAAIVSAERRCEINIDEFTVATIGRTQEELGNDAN